MIVGQILWLLGLFTITYAHVSTCTDLSWENKAEREHFTLYNAGNHILVLNVTRQNCFEDEKNFGYTNKSFLLNPGQSFHLSGDPWVSDCSATFCSACLIYQCNVIAQLNPNSTLVLLYNASDSIDFSAVRYTQLSRKKKLDQQPVVCPSDMASIWAKTGLPTAVIDIPNKKKKKTVYTVEVMCNDSYIMNDNGTAIDHFTYTTPVIKSRAEVIVLIPLKALREVPGTCTLNVCLHRKYICGQKISCIFTIPDESVELEKLDRREKPKHKLASCSQTQWIWTVVDEQTGNLNLNLRNKDWKEKTFRISVHCQELSTIDDTVLITIPPMVHTRLVTFPLTISMMNISTKSTKCVIQVCNTAKAKCGRTTKCPITLPVNEGKFIIEPVNKTDNKETGECKSKLVTLSLRGKIRGTVTVHLSNPEQKSVIADVSLNCPELDVTVAKESTVELPPNSLHTMNFKLRISSIDDTAVATHCTLKICNNGDCENQGKTCTVTIPASNGYFSKDKNGDGNKEKKEIHKMKRQNNKRRKICPSDIISFNHSSSDLPTAFVYVENTKKKVLPFVIDLSCTNVNVLQDNGTVSGSLTKTIPSIQPKALEVMNFTFQNNGNPAKTCVLNICIQRATRCASVTSCEITSFLPMASNDDVIPESCDRLNHTWTVHKPRRGNFDVILHNNLMDEHIVFTVTLECGKLEVSNNSITVILAPMNTKMVSFTLKPFSVRKSDTTTECVVEICNGDCRNELACIIDIPVDKKRFVISANMPTITLMPKEQYVNLTEYSECTQKEAVWEVEKSYRGLLKVKPMNRKEEEMVFLITLRCRNIEPVKDKTTKLITVPGKSFRAARFKFMPKIEDQDIGTNVTHCVIDVCAYGDCDTGEKETCIIKIAFNKNGKFAIALPPRKKHNETKFILHKCHDRYSDNEIQSHTPCNDRLWDLVYTSAQLEGEALLIITLKLKSNKQVDLQTNVSLSCEGIIIEDEAQKILLLSKYERKRNVSFAIATIRSLHLERHICKLNILYSLLIPSKDNITDDAIDELCLKEKKCTIAIDSRLGRIVPKCNFHQVQSSISSTDVDQRMAKVTFSVAPSVYDVYTYDAHCSVNNPFTHDSIKEKKENTFVSESKETKMVVVDYAPDCNNDTIRKEFENYRKDDCDFLLYGYCQGGELLLESFEDIHFDDDHMYCTPQLLFNKWLQSIQKHTGIHSKPLAAILAIFAIVILLIAIIIPVITVIYLFCCRHHRDDSKRQSIGIVISSCDEWDETNALLNAMSEENSKFLIGRSDQKLRTSPHDSVSDDSDVETPIYRFDSGPVKQHDHINRVDSITFHDSEDQHDHHHKPFDQQDSMTNSINLNEVIKQLDTIHGRSPEEENSKLSATRTDFSSTLDGWGDEYAD